METVVCGFLAALAHTLYTPAPAHLLAIFVIKIKDFYVHTSTNTIALKSRHHQASVHAQKIECKQTVWE